MVFFSTDVNMNFSSSITSTIDARFQAQSPQRLIPVGLSLVLSAGSAGTRSLPRLFLEDAKTKRMQTSARGAVRAASLMGQMARMRLMLLTSATMVARQLCASLSEARSSSSQPHYLALADAGESNMP